MTVTSLPPNAHTHTHAHTRRFTNADLDSQGPVCSCSANQSALHRLALAGNSSERQKQTPTKSESAFYKFSWLCVETLKADKHCPMCEFPVITGELQA